MKVDKSFTSLNRCADSDDRHCTDGKIASDGLTEMVSRVTNSTGISRSALLTMTKRENHTGELFNQYFSHAVMQK